MHNHLNKKVEMIKDELDQKLRSSGISDRIVDDIQVSSYNPYEYGMILQNAGYPIRFKKENFLLADQIFRKIQFVSPDKAKPIILKNPPDFVSVSDIKSCFPNAKLILIARDPLHVLNSQLKFWRFYYSKETAVYSYIWRQHERVHSSPLATSLGKLFFSKPLGWRLLTSISTWSQERYLYSLSSLSTSDYVLVRYEDLCKHPNDTIQTILSYLGLELSDKLDFRDLVQPRSPKLLPEILDNASIITRRLDPLNEFWGYA
ncbi:MAG: sulfotransferase [Synechococcaceae cyanobacterium SM2_3_1]|nr:sulfotransferase [Synechococcaceae cyanobacterium SM2_3_1]